VQPAARERRGRRPFAGSVSLGSRFGRGENGFIAVKLRNSRDCQLDDLVLQPILAGEANIKNP